MTLSEELLWRGFVAKTTIKEPAILDNRPSKKFYFGADPSADSLTIGNLAALMMCACFVRYGYKPYFLVGGATGQIGDPKENSERELKSLEEVEHNKKCLKVQLAAIMPSNDFVLLDNLDWLKDITYLGFLREIGKVFSMTQLLDRQFVQNRIGKDGSGLSYAEFSYTLIQGYDFLYLYRKYGIDLELCGADQYGNCVSGIHLIKRLENETADVWSTPLVVDPITGRKFGKSEGNAIWLSAKDNGSGNFTRIFDFYQFWLNQSDEAVESLLKVYTTFGKSEIESLLSLHTKNPEQRLAQKSLAKNVTAVVHGEEAAKTAVKLTESIFNTKLADDTFSKLLLSIKTPDLFLPTVKIGTNLLDALVMAKVASSKSAARKLIEANAIAVNGEKILDEKFVIEKPSLIKKGKNKFIICA